MGRVSTEYRSVERVLQLIVEVKIENFVHSVQPFTSTGATVFFFDKLSVELCRMDVWRPCCILLMRWCRVCRGSSRETKFLRYACDSEWIGAGVIRRECSMTTVVVFCRCVKYIKQR